MLNYLGLFSTLLVFAYLLTCLTFSRKMSPYALHCSYNTNLLTYGLGEKEARRPTPKWNTRFYLAFSIRA